MKPSQLIKIFLLILFLSTSVCTFFINDSYADITSNLVAWWKFNDGSGSTAVDSSGNSNTGTLVNSPTWVAGKITTYAIDFLGSSNQKMTVSTIALGSSWTIAFWIYYISSSSYGNLGAFNNVTGLYSFSGKIDYYYGGDNLSAGSIPTNTWTHIVVVNTAGTITYYFNGVLDANSNAHGNTLNFDTLGSDNGNENVTAYFDDYRLYTRALSSADITQLYTYQLSKGITGISSLQGVTSIHF
jgi:hypothetical protein